ncbi:hypothetical protein ACLB2K_075016 [Fragaria x ananassa]
MWYTRLSDYLIMEGYKIDELCPCVFIKKTSSGFAIGIIDEIKEIAAYLKSEFEMKNLGKTRFCLGLEQEHQVYEIFIHQSAYVQKILKQFNMDKMHPVSTPMIGRSLDITKDPFRPKEDDEEVLAAYVSYLSAIGALLYLAQCTRPDIAFSVNFVISVHLMSSKSSAGVASEIQKEKKRSMVDELEAMLEVVDPQPSGKSLSMRRRTFDMPDGVIQREIAEGCNVVVVTGSCSLVEELEGLAYYESQSAFNLSALGRIYEEVGILLHNHPTIKVQYVRRTANNVAHVMASNSKQFSSETFYFSVPSFLQIAVAAEIVQV